MKIVAVGKQYFFIMHGSELRSERVIVVTVGKSATACHFFYIASEKHFLSGPSGGRGTTQLVF